jgi:surface antigen
MATDNNIPSFKQPLCERALQFAQGEIGKQEHPKGSNWGPDVQIYLASVGITSPASWCMAFVYYCFASAAKILSVINPLYRTGGVMNQWYNAHANNKIIGEPMPGDIFIMEFPHGMGHTGIVEKVEGDYIHSIEGNTNEDGSREGYEVARRKRLKSSVHGYLRYI